MTVPCRRATDVPDAVSRPTPCAGPGGMSSPKVSASTPARRDVLTYRQHFALMWRDFIRSNYESPAHAAMVFRVDPSTAENWFAGSNAPQGWVVGRALADPDTRDAALSMLGAAE